MSGLSFFGFLSEEYAEEKEIVYGDETGNYTLLESDKGKVIRCDGTFNVTLPAGLTEGWWCIVRNIGAGTITFVEDTGVTNTTSVTEITTTDTSCVVENIGSNEYYLEF